MKEEKNVTEDMPCEPLTDYSKFKLMCEEDLKKGGLDTCWTIVRPATVCGYASRMRLDLSVNILTISALVRNRIIVNGGEQLRPNLNIFDMAKAYARILVAPEESVRGQTFNVGYENMSIMNIARLVNSRVPSARIEVHPVHDNRSYHINSDKIKNVLGFKASNTIDDAIAHIIKMYRVRFIQAHPLENSLYFNIQRMKELISEGQI